MTRKHIKAMKSVSPQSTDDLTRIHGIGPAIQKRLHSSGIHTYAQLAALSPANIVAIVPHTSLNKIRKQNWVHRASELASSEKSSKTFPTSHQHYENFTLEFLLDEKNKIRRMQIISIQTGDTDTLTKWEPERLIDFLAHHTGARLRYAKSPHQAVGSTSTSLPPMLVEQQPETNAELIPASLNQPPEKCGLEQVDKPVILPSEPFTTPDTPFSRPVSQKSLSPTISASTISQIRVLEWKTRLAGTNQPVSHITHDQAFNINLIIDLSSAGFLAAPPLNLSAAIYARQLGKGPRQIIAETCITRPYANIMQLTIEHLKLPPGLYRLEALLTICPTKTPAVPKSGIATSVSGGLIQIY